MVPEEQRDSEGRLKVPFFVAALQAYMEFKGQYKPQEFKEHIEAMEILTDADWELENNGYAKWKHRVDRAAQKVFTDV